MIIHNSKDIRYLINAYSKVSGNQTKLASLYLGQLVYENRPLSQWRTKCLKVRQVMWFPTEQEFFITSSHVKSTTTKQLYALLRAMHAFEILINMISRIVMFLEEFQKNWRHCESGLLGLHTCYFSPPRIFVVHGKLLPIHIWDNVLQPFVMIIPVVKFLLQYDVRLWSKIGIDEIVRRSFPNSSPASYKMQHEINI